MKILNQYDWREKQKVKISQYKREVYEMYDKMKKFQRI